jgi:hypothetical protein
MELTATHHKKVARYTGRQTWADSCEHSNELPGSIKGRELLD